jgi:hypothetical protein
VEPDAPTPGWPQDAPRTTPARFILAVALSLVIFATLAIFAKPDLLGFVLGGLGLVALYEVFDRVLIVRRRSDV